MGADPTAFQRLFSRRATRHVRREEDFTTEILCVAVSRDPRPLALALQSIDEAEWERRPCSHRPVDLSHVVRGEAATQRWRHHKELPGKDGRLDLVVTLTRADGSSQTIWIEVKVDAGLTYNDEGNQLKRYIAHRDHRFKDVTVVSLAKKAPIVDCVVGLTWAGLIEAVERTDGVNGWWCDLVDFLRAEGTNRPAMNDRDFDDVMPVFELANRRIRELWPDRPTFDRIDGQLRRKVRAYYRELAHPWLAGRPLRYGCVPTKDGWEWRVDIAVTGRDSDPVRVGAGEILDVAESGLHESGPLPATWERTGDDDAVVQKRREAVGDDSGMTAGAWLLDAIDEVNRHGVLEPYIQAWRARSDAGGDAETG